MLDITNKFPPYSTSPDDNCTNPGLGCHDFVSSGWYATDLDEVCKVDQLVGRQDLEQTSKWSMLKPLEKKCFLNIRDSQN